MKNFYFATVDGVKTLKLRLEVSSFKITDDDGFLTILCKMEYSKDFEKSIREKAASEREFIVFWTETNQSIKNFPFNKELDSACEFISQAREIFIQEYEEVTKVLEALED